MAKAINLPQKFLEEVMNEDSATSKIALRLGSLYFDNAYYSVNEIVDIRVDHKIARKAVIMDDMRLFKIKDMPEEVLKMYKTSLREKSGIINFLADNYKQPVDEETFVTVITYKNLAKEMVGIVDDPHL